MESTQASPKGAPSLTAGSERDTQRPRGLGNSSSAQLPPSSSSSSPSAVCADSMMLPMLAIWKLRTRRGCAEGTPPVSARVAWAKRPRSAAAAAPQRAEAPRGLRVRAPRGAAAMAPRRALARRAPDDEGDERGPVRPARQQLLRGGQQLNAAPIVRVVRERADGVAQQLRRHAARQRQDGQQEERGQPAGGDEHERQRGNARPRHVVRQQRQAAEKADGLVPHARRRVGQRRRQRILVILLCKRRVQRQRRRRHRSAAGCSPRRSGARGRRHAGDTDGGAHVFGATE